MLHKSSVGFIGRRACINWIMLIYFASGACSLIDEVVWVRLLKLTLGNTVYATSIVVSVFMGGLALGALIMGRYCDSVRRRLRLYALLETLVTISALSLPWGLKLADGVYVRFFRTYHPTHTHLLFVQVLISAAILLVPSMLMGSTLPLLGRFVTSLEREAGHLVGRLYALNTLGAAAGCFLAGFILIRTVGVMGSLYIAAGLNLLVAFGGWFLSRFSGITVEEQVEAVALQSGEGAAAKTMDGRFYMLIAAFFMSGLISIGYELLWMRSIVHLLGGFTYVFSAVLTIYLLGNVIGAGIGSALVKKLKTPAVWFAVTLSLLGLYGVFYLPLLVFWTSKGMWYINRHIIGNWIPFSRYLVRPIVQSLFLFLVPSVIMGIGFPIALQAWANHMHKVGRSTATAYGANTIGAVIGGIVTGFFLIPLLGVQLSISILGLSGVWIAAVMWAFFVHRPSIVGRYVLLTAAVILAIITLKIPRNLFSAVIEASPLVPGFELVQVKEGIATTASVHRDTSGTLYLYSSGQTLAGENYTARGDQKMLGHFGVLLNSNARGVLSVGFGSGESTFCLAQHKLDRVDCVEIAPEIVEISLKFFRKLNLGDRLNEEVNMIYMDAKNYLHLTDINYDVIFNDCIHPRFFAENASLYAKEYFESAKKNLRSRKGLFLSYVPLYKMTPFVLNSIVGTAMDVFPHVTIWYLTPHPAPLVVIVGSEHEQYFSPKHIEDELLKEGVRKSLAEINIHNSLDVLSCYICDEQDLRKHIKEFSINSDYFPFIEFVTDEELDTALIFDSFVMNIRNDSIYHHIDWTGFSDEQKAGWITDYRQLYNALTYILPVLPTPNAPPSEFSRFGACMAGLGRLPDNPVLLRTRDEAARRLYSDFKRMILSGRTDTAQAYSRELIKQYPDSPLGWLVRSSVMRDKGEGQEAVADARRAVDIAPDNTDARFNLGFMLYSVGQFEQAIIEYKEALRLANRPDEINVYNQSKILNFLARAYAGAGRFSEAIATAEKALELALSSSQEELADDIREHIDLFKQAQSSQRQP